jgi:FXSXX-COOH protein
MGDSGTDAPADGPPGHLGSAANETGGPPACADPEAGIDTGIVDLTGLSLGDLDHLGQSALAIALRRVLEREGEPANLVVGFQSGI